MNDRIEEGMNNPSPSRSAQNSFFYPPQLTLLLLLCAVTLDNRASLEVRRRVQSSYYYFQLCVKGWILSAAAATYLGMQMAVAQKKIVVGRKWRRATAVV